MLEVADEQLPANAGRWALDAAPDGVACDRTGDEPDVTLSTATLAALALGGHCATQLADAGLLAGTDVAVVRRLDRLFAVDRSPWTPFKL